MNRVNKIKSKKYDLDKENREFKKQIENKTKELKQKLLDLQSKCGHEITTFHSCQYDSYTRCDICGKEL